MPYLCAYKQTVVSMTEEEKIVREFYEAFAAHDVKGMVSRYHEEVVFDDPAFRALSYKQVSIMWMMLLRKAKESKLEVVLREASGANGKAYAVWEAKYLFGKDKAPVHNVIRAEMELKDGKIYRHRDSFDFYKWLRQAFGWKGVLFGWTPFFQQAFRRQAMGMIAKVGDRVKG